MAVCPVVQPAHSSDVIRGHRGVLLRSATLFDVRDAIELVARAPVQPNLWFRDKLS
ncbi:hypothetical protein CHELA1G11_10780 [Hyphomicrobiales bacterium]|nr:hypothetical protein CHELA1G11_10780 [Hyphomicrobiales bacterium]CAH1672299.1 hypothetical protein CHELA1G2_13526 [Hyphomicrobiales bacterium]